MFEDIYKSLELWRYKLYKYKKKIKRILIFKDLYEFNKKFRKKT